MRVLNLYAGIGGNRKLWENCEVTAIEFNPEVAAVYQDLFPNDTVIVADAHQYLLDHYQEFDFIWASPPCPTHSRSRFARHSTLKEQKYPDMTLYQEIIFLQHYFEGKFVVENVIAFYDPLIAPTKILQRHWFWSNFRIGNFEIESSNMEDIKISDLEVMHGYDLSKYDFDKLKALRNCVHPKVGQYIMDCALNIVRKENISQLVIF